MKSLSVVCLLCCAPIYAALTTPSAQQQALDTATIVADIEVESLEGIADSQYGAKSVATARVLVVHAVRDDGGWIPAKGQTLRMETLGGEVGDMGVLYSGYPRPYRGRRYRASLRRESGGTFSIAGMHAGLVPLDPTRAYSRNRTDGSNGSGNGPFLYWDPDYFPIPYYLSLPAFRNQIEVANAIDLSFKPWRDPGNVKLEFLAMGCTSTTSNRNDGVNAILFVGQDWEFDPTAIAITRNFYVSGTGPRAGLILDTDIMLNDMGYDFTTTAEAGMHDVRDIVTHEVGHLIGLGHEVVPLDTNATMYESAIPGETNKRALHASDLAGLEAAYGGVGQKFDQFSTTDACSLGWQRLSCASVHGPARNPALYGWMLLVLVGALSLGRSFFRY